MLKVILSLFELHNIHINEILGYLLDHNFFFSAPENSEISAAQLLILLQTVKRLKDITQRVGQEHKDLHSSVSKVGKAIDRVCILSLIHI